MATITRKIDSVSVTLLDGGVLAALSQEANVFPQDNTVRINGVDYFLNTLSFGGAGSGTFANATWDVLFNDGNVGWINQWPAGSSVRDIDAQGDRYIVQGNFGRNGYTSTATATITDSNGLMNALPVGANTKSITADMSTVMFWGTVKSVLLPGTYRIIFTLTDGSTTKSRTVDVVISAYPSTAPGDGWL